MMGRFYAVLAPFAHWPRALGLIWAAAPRWTVAWAVLLVLQGILPALPVYLTRPLINSVVAATQSGGTWAAVQPVFWWGGLMVAAMLLIDVLGRVLEWVRTAQSELISDFISARIHERSLAVDYAFYEHPEFYDKLDQARSQASTRTASLLESGGALLQNGITLLTMVAVLVPYGVWLPLLLVTGTLPALAVVAHFNRRYHRWWAQTTADRRWIFYYDTMITHRDAAAEIRLYGLGGFFRTAFQTLRQRHRSERLRMLQQQSIAQLGAGVLALLVSGAVMAWMVWRAIQGRATLGDVALFYQAFQRGEGLVRTLLNSVGQMYSHSLFLASLFDFLDLPAHIGDPVAPVAMPRQLRTGIRFRDITFRYPGSANPSLQHFDLFVPANKVIAIVGANGAGKSTFVKLLCRLYDPASGSVEIDDVDLRAFAVADVRCAVNVLFQFPMSYQATAHDNIRYGDLAAQDHDVVAAARAAGAHAIVAELPHGYQTMLGKWFAEGVELSGGEWQRVATARAYVRPAPIVVLDEPTSAMDSWAEADWFERFRSMMRGRTGIIITHRFTIAMRADIIHVMDGGRIIESGTHRELLARGGRYAASWYEQLRAAGEPIEERAL